MSENRVSVTEFGAVPNSDKVQTDCFQNAIDHIFSIGGGKVEVPSGVYVIGEIRLRSNVTLHLLENSVIKGSIDPCDYRNILNDKLEPLPEDQLTDLRWIKPKEWLAMGGGFKAHLYAAGSYWNYGLIRAVFAENVSIIGEKGSLIDGSNVYDPEGEEKYRGPHTINMHFCKNLFFAGYSVKNAGNWAHAIFRSENVTFESLNVQAGHDALHTRACSNVKIKNCVLETGDDCIAGFDNLGVHVENCDISSACSAFRFGGNNILIENCRIFAPCKYQFRGSFSPEEKASGALVSEKGRSNMLSFFTYFVTDDLSPRMRAGKIRIRNCKIDGADRMLHINLSGNESWQRGDSPTDITFENIDATNIMTGFYAYGNEGKTFDLNLKNISLEYREGYEKEPLIKAANYGEINIENVYLKNYSGNALVKKWSVGGRLVINGLDAAISPDETEVMADEPFVCKAI